jgi:hypothetical protein
MIQVSFHGVRHAGERDEPISGNARTPRGFACLVH